VRSTEFRNEECGETKKRKTKQKQKNEKERTGKKTVKNMVRWLAGVK